jgi:serine/threonine protein kinase
MKCRTIDLAKFEGSGEDAKILAALLVRNVILYPDKPYELQVDGRADIVMLSHAIVPRSRSNHKNMEGVRYSVIGMMVGEGCYGNVVDVVTLSVENGLAKICNPNKSRVAKIQHHSARKVTPEIEHARFENEKQQTLKANYLHAKSPYLIFSHRLEQSILVMRKFDGPTLADLIAEDALIRAWYPPSCASRLETYIPKLLENDDRVEYSINLLQALHEQAHSGGVVNLDVKPDNIIANAKTKKITLVDLGCARNFGEVRPEHFIVGTQGYLAPEVKNGHPKFSCISQPESDLYSVGVTLRNLWGDNTVLFEDTETLVERDLERGLSLIPNLEVQALVRRVLISLTQDDAKLRMPLLEAIALLKEARVKLYAVDTSQSVTDEHPSGSEICFPVLGEFSEGEDEFSPCLKRLK